MGRSGHLSPVRVEYHLGEGTKSRRDVSITVDAGLFGVGFLLALFMGLLSLEGAAVQTDGGILCRSLVWGAFVGAVAGGLVGLFPCFRHVINSHKSAVGSIVSCMAALILVGMSLCGLVNPSVGGVIAGALWLPVTVSWLCTYAVNEPWTVALHISGALVMGGLLYLLGLSWAGGAPITLPYLAVLTLAACASLLVQTARMRRDRLDNARPVGYSGEDIHVGESTPQPQRALATFAKTQWAPLAGMALLAFVHGLRWRSNILGFSTAKPYALNGLEYLLGPLLAVLCAWLVFRCRTVTPPQRTACQVLLPVAAAVLLLVPVLNPLRGFYEAVDTAHLPWTVLEMALDVINEGAASLLVLSALLSVVTAPRTCGLAASTVGCALVASTAGGFLLGVHGYMAVGINGTIVCFLAWTVYLLAAGLSSIGKDRSAREGERFVRETMDGFIRRASHGLAEAYGLSQREEEILRYLARGYSYTYTAQDFCISENTVRTHAKHIYAKLGITKREELFALLDAQGMAAPSVAASA